MKITIKMAFNLAVGYEGFENSSVSDKKMNIKSSTIFQATADCESHPIL